MIATSAIFAIAEFRIDRLAMSPSLMAVSSSDLLSAAAIVVFHPDRSILKTTVSRISRHVRSVLVYANSPVPEVLESELRREAASTPLHIITPEGNVGLGTAYNTLFDIAAKGGARYLLLLDQDSSPLPEMIPQLEGVLISLEVAGARPALVGPQPVTEAAERLKLPRRGNEIATVRATPVDFAISSGSLISVEAFRIVGGFRADFFIDAIDIEWCLRAWQRGWSIWVSEQVTMVHRLGQGVIALPFGLRLTDQPPRRLYTYLRNHIAMLRLSHVPLRRKLVTLGYLPLQCLVFLARKRLSRPMLRAVRAGLADGALQKLGPPQRTWDWIDSTADDNGA